MNRQEVTEELDQLQRSVFEIYAQISAEPQGDAELNEGDRLALGNMFAAIDEAKERLRDSLLVVRAPPRRRR